MKPGPVERLLDYNVSVRVESDGTDVDIGSVKMSMNPFNEIGAKLEDSSDSILDRVRLEIADDGVARLVLSRPSKMNALDPAMFAALREAADRLRGDPRVRVVLMSGEGRGFCAGLDMANFARLGDGQVIGGLDDLLPRTHGIANAWQQVAWAWRELPVPVIAVLHGVAYGGGLQIALGADLRFATPDAQLSVMEAKWGLVPDMAGTVFLRELVRADVARELTFSARVFTGEEALRLGVVTRVCVDPFQEALALARHIAASSPSAIRAAKRLLNRSATDTPAEMLSAESMESQQLLGSSNQVEAVRAVLERRAPAYRDT